jgi:hypothetical protein
VFSRPVDPLKHRFLDLAEVSFGASQEAENACSMPGDHMNHRFLELDRVAFWVRQQEENEFAAQTTQLDNACSTTPKSARRQKMSSQVQPTP